MKEVYTNKHNSNSNVDDKEEELAGTMYDKNRLKDFKNPGWYRYINDEYVYDGFKVSWGINGKGLFIT